MNDHDQPEHVERLQTELGKLAATADLSRRVALSAIAVLIVVGIGLIAVAVASLGFDPAAVAAIAAAILIGVAFLAWHRHKMRLYADLLKSIDANKSGLAGKPDLPGDDTPADIR